MSLFGQAQPGQAAAPGLPTSSTHSNLFQSNQTSSAALSFGAPKSSITGPVGLFQPITTASATAGTSGFSFSGLASQPAASSAVGGGFSVAPKVATTTASAAGSLFSSLPATSAPTASLFPAAAAASSATAPNSASVAPIGLFSSGSAKAAASSNPVSSIAVAPLFPQKSIAAVGAGAATVTVSSGGLAAPAGSVPAAAGQTAAGMSFRGVEDSVNKWNEELDELETQFIAQATQVNAWDRLVLENGDKIALLNQELGKIQVTHDRLEQDLDFIATQQVDMEALLLPLEEALSSAAAARGAHGPGIHTSPLLGGGAVASAHDTADAQRANTFQQAENVDSQLKQMAKKLREVIDRVNANTSNEDLSCLSAFGQLERVLNVHVDSLSWVDKNLETLTKRIDYMHIPPTAESFASR